LDQSKDVLKDLEEEDTVNVLLEIQGDILFVQMDIIGQKVMNQANAILMKVNMVDVNIMVCTYK
jgi:hypothetical protein